jgi:hypothetical protein
MAIFRSRPARADAMGIAEDTVRGGEGAGTGAITAVASALALLFSAYSLYETSVRRADLRAFVPPVIAYSQPNNNSFEVFEIPVTVMNIGARAGTVLSMELEVENPRTKTRRKFYSSDFGRWTVDNARSGTAFKAYAPISVPGKASWSDSVLFFSRDDQPDQTIAEQKGGLYRFKLTPVVAFPEDLGILDRAWAAKPEPLTFEMVMPEIDHRVFNAGTLQLHAPQWRVAAPGASNSADVTASTDEMATQTSASATPATGEASAPKPSAEQIAAHDALVESLKAKCKDEAPGAKLSSAGFNAKTGVSASAEYVCP